MKCSLILLYLCVAVLLTGAKPADNPFFGEWKTPFGTPPFDQIRPEHFIPAIEKGIEVHSSEIAAIANSTEPPTFENTVVALDRSGKTLDRVTNVFFALESALTGEQMQEIAKKLSPALSRHEDAVLLNDKLFQRLKTVVDQTGRRDLTGEQKRLLSETYKKFVRGGALLKGTAKDQLTEINARLSVLSLKFGENVLKENNRFEMVIDDRADLVGLPDGIIAAAAETANERGHEGKWVFTLHKPSMIPFLQYSPKRDLRRKLYMGYTHRGDHGDKFDNKKLLAEMAALRVTRARLLGFPTHAHYVLDDVMAKEPEQVYSLLHKVWTPALEKAKQEVAEMQQMIDAEGGKFRLASWDWWYYAEKVKKAKYDLDEEMLRPYFQLENVRDGAFEVAHRLYGLQFKARRDISVYHEDVSVFEVLDAEGDHVGILYVDYFPRASKRGGAWMAELRFQRENEGTDIRPIIYNVGNFSKPTGDKPSLLSFEEVSTLFHEFGHALHGLVSRCKYRTLSCTNVARDFVEMPSQIMENWAAEPEVLKLYARHFQTGHPIPDALIDKIRKARHFNQGFATTEYLAAAFLDMDWHTMRESQPDIDVHAFESASMQKIGLIEEIVPRYRSEYFRHIFAGDYSSGYYSYVWSEVLDADAFQAFKETGNVFDPTVATKFHDIILSRGGTADPMKMYREFRGHDPAIEPLLKRRGLK